MRTKSVTFTNRDGHGLSARLEMPLGDPPSHYAIFAHCFTCGKGIKAATTVSRALTQKGFAVLRFDFTGLGQSEGDFAETAFTTNVDDLVDAGLFLEKHYAAPRLLIGHSLGGTAVVHAAAKMDAIEALVTIGAPFEASHVTHLFSGKKADIVKQGRAEVNIGGRPFEIGKKFIEDLEAHSTASLLPNLRKALLVMHSPQDRIVDIANAAGIFTAAHHPKSFITLDGADHLLSADGDGDYVAEVVAAWAGRYLPRREKPGIDTAEDVAVQLGSDGYTTEIVAGKHRLLADEPAEVGGNNLGPTPYQLLSAALGTCTAMTLKMYAAQKKWPLEQVTVHLAHRRHHAEDSAHPESGASRVDNFKVSLELKGELDAAQRTRLLEIAERCPVHRTLTDKRITIETSALE